MEKYKKITHGLVATKIIEDLDVMMTDLKAFLRECGLDTEGLSYEEVLKSVRELNVLKRPISYKGLVFDENGYIIDAFKINNFYDVRFLPKDVDRGYYFVNRHNQIELDYERKRQIEEV